jgi:hypothetical protein
MSEKQQLLAVLKKYLPTGTEEYATELLLRHRIHLHIKRPRQTKYGDYRPPLAGENHRISVNKDLNPYAFLITFLHEVAHLLNFEKNRGRVQPHGQEWKWFFREVSTPVFQEEVLPRDVHQSLNIYLSNPKASSCSSPQLVRTLRKYDADTTWVLVEEVPANTAFETKDGRSFVKGERMRTRYRCVESATGKVFLVPGLMQCRLKI